MVSTNGKPIDIYVRQSSTKDPNYMGSPESQEQIAKGYLIAHDISVGITIVERISGAKTNRPGLNKALDRIKSGDSGGICVAYQSRFFRNLAGFIDTLEIITKYGGVLIGPGIGDYDTPEGEKYLLYSAVDDAAYVKRSRLNAHNGRIIAVQKGNHFGKWTPIGYSKVAKKLIPNADAPTIKEVFKLRAGGKGPQTIADIVNEEPYNLRGRENKKVTRTTIWQILHNPIYKGRLEYRQNGTLIIANDDAVEDPIVDKSLWDAAQRPGKRVKPSGKYPNTCTGILKCPKCNHTLTATTNGNGSRFYRCMQGCKDRLHIAASMIEPLIEHVFKTFIEDIRVREFDTPPEYKGLEAEYEAASRAYTNLYDDNDMRELDYVSWKSKVTELKEKRDSLAADLNDLKVIAEQIQSTPIFEATLFERWDELSSTNKNDLYRWAFNSVIIKRIAKSRRRKNIKNLNNQFDIAIEFTPTAAHFLKDIVVS